MQTSFDLHRRVYLGGGWAPDLESGSRRLDRPMIEAGLLELQSLDRDRNPTRHRLHLVEGQIRLNPVTINGYLARYDLSNRRRDPLLRVTTFLGEPRRGDLTMNTGFFIEMGRLDTWKTAEKSASHVRYATAMLTFDFWQSSDLSSYIRIRGGGSLERPPTSVSTDTPAWVTPAVAADADFTFDRDGFYHLELTAQGEAVPQLKAAPGKKTVPLRMRAEAAFEMILLALNDQPVSLRVGGAGTKRDDIELFGDRVNLQATAALRLSLWAPVRETER